MAAFAECRNAAVGTIVHFAWYILSPGRERLLFAEYTAKSPVRPKPAIFHPTVSQILLFSLASRDWDRGIGCLLHILQERTDERESVLLALAALYIEKSGAAGDRTLREEYRSAAAACLDEAEETLPGGSRISESVLRLRKELEER